jgi:hypothetical protein
VYPEQENTVILPLLPLEIRAPCKARWVWASAVIFASASCSLQFAEASAATLSQQEKNNSADVRQGRVNLSGFVCTAANLSSRRRTFDEFLSMAVALRRAHQHYRAFVCTVGACGTKPRHAGGRCVAVCLKQFRALHEAMAPIAPAF